MGRSKITRSAAAAAVLEGTGVIQGQGKLRGSSRVAALLLAGIWLSGGLVALVLGCEQRHWLAVLLGSVATAYGLLWLTVAARGRLLSWRELLSPWRRLGS